MNYGIELEFFIRNKSTGDIVPAYKVTNNVDGNPVIGEIRTGVHNNIVDCIFELKKLIHLEREKLYKKDPNLMLIFQDVITLSDVTLKALRADRECIQRKEHTVLEELSIYPDKKTGKLLPRGVFKASLQVNFSENKMFSFTEYEKVTVEDKYKYVSKSANKSYAGLFDYVSIIRRLDIAFAKEIVNTKRVKGVYAIKEGLLGDRIEYRSLPNTIDLNELLSSLS